ncbi:MAG: 3-dehydroquinate synthase [Arenicellales bacterium]
MSTVSINLGSRSYDIRIERGLLSVAEEITPWIKGKQIFIISNEIVASLYLDRLKSSLDSYEVHEFLLPDGEQTKTLANFSLALDKMLSVPCNRSVTVIALGGGVVGDLAGFVAASYLRGVTLIQVPTTLLSQVDSSVGGKTGVNHELGKNMIGAFYQPKRVLIDTETLSTLDPRQLSSGLAEVIKYGLIADYELFCWLELNMESVRALDPLAIEHIVTRSCINKSKIVEQDELEGGIRAILNLGHTFGHAIETATGYTTWLHGEAVATGIMMAAHMSSLYGWLGSEECDRVEHLLSKAALPAAPFQGIGPSKMLQLMQVDKKVQDGQLRLVLLKGLGSASVIEGPDSKYLNATLEYFAEKN